MAEITNTIKRINGKNYDELALFRLPEQRGSGSFYGKANVHPNTYLRKRKFSTRGVYLSFVGG